MLQIKGLTITNKKDLRELLTDFHLTLNDGDKAVIIGEEGNGKSTLLKWIFCPAFTEVYTDAEGDRITGKEILGYLPQELPEDDRLLSVYEYFSGDEKFWEQTPKSLSELAKDFGTEPDFFYRDQPMGTLSGGEKIKAQLMRLLMIRPTVLLLDEPSNDIDLSTLMLLERIIRDWPHIVLFISHDEVLIEHTANMIIHIEQLHKKAKSRFTVARVPYRDYLQMRKNAFEKQEAEAINDRREKKIRDEKFRRIMQSVEHAQSSVSRQDPSAAKNLKDKMHTVKSMGKRFEKQDAAMTEIPEEEEAIFFKLGGPECAVPNGKVILDLSLPVLCAPPDSFGEESVLARDISLFIKGPEKVCIIGANGCGKTTLLKKIAEQLLSRSDIRAQYMPQNYRDVLDLTMTPVDFLDSSGEKEERTRIRTFLGSLKYTPDEMDHPIKELSGGQKAKILLLKMSLSDANVLILDEPTRNFSPLSGPVIRTMIKSFPGTVISISHDRKYISEVCSKVYLLTENGLVLQDFPAGGQK